MYANTLKFAYGFEYSLVKDGTCISAQSSRMATMFLRLLRISVFSTHLQQEPSLWEVSRKNRSQGSIQYGIGLRETLNISEYGYIQSEKID